jgi:hypothetical protein
MCEQTTLKRIDQFGPTRTHIVRNNNGRGTSELCKRDTQGISGLRVQLIWHNAANVIRLYDCIKIGHNESGY